MTSPAYLKKGDAVSIVSTARKIARTELDAAIHILEQWGLTVHLGETPGAAYHQFAGTDDERTSDFNAALGNPDIKAIICARGGYGTVRIIDRLDLTNCSKWVVGYSDVTVLHSHLTQGHNCPSIHGTMPINFANNTEQALNSLRAALFGEPLAHECSAHALNRVGNCTGEVVGGNLSILYSLMGSKSELDTTGKILFIEDLDEYLYHVDRMMQNLKRAGKLANLAGLIVGGMSDMNDNEVPFGLTAEEIILETVKAYDYPVCFGFPAGHIDDNRALYMNKKATLEVANTTRLAYL